MTRVAAPEKPCGIRLHAGLTARVVKGPGGGGRPALPGCLDAFLALTTLSLETDLPWSYSVTVRGYITPPIKPSLVVNAASLAASFAILLRKHSNSMTILGRHLHIRCITKLASSPTPALAFLFFQR